MSADPLDEITAERDALRVIAKDFDEVLREEWLRCECGGPDCRTTRLDAALAKFKPMSLAEETRKLEGIKIIGELPEGATVLGMIATDKGVVVATSEGAFLVTQDGLASIQPTHFPEPPFGPAP